MRRQNHVPSTRVLEVTTLTAEQAAHLQASPGDNAFYVDRLAYTEVDGHRFPAVWFQAVYRESNFDLKAWLRSSL